MKKELENTSILTNVNCNIIEEINNVNSDLLNFIYQKFHSPPLDQPVGTLDPWYNFSGKDLPDNKLGFLNTLFNAEGESLLQNQITGTVQLEGEEEKINLSEDYVLNKIWISDLNRHTKKELEILSIENDNVTYKILKKKILKKKKGTDKEVDADTEADKQINIKNLSEITTPYIKNIGNIEILKINKDGTVVYKNKAKPLDAPIKTKKSELVGFNLDLPKFLKNNPYINKKEDIEIIFIGDGDTLVYKNKANWGTDAIQTNVSGISNSISQRLMDKKFKKTIADKIKSTGSNTDDDMWKNLELQSFNADGSVSYTIIKSGYDIDTIKEIYNEVGKKIGPDTIYNSVIKERFSGDRFWEHVLSKIKERRYKMLVILKAMKLNQERKDNISEKEKKRKEKDNAEAGKAAGFKIGDSVQWAKSDTDVPNNDTGKIIAWRDEKKALVEFSNGQWVFPLSSLIKEGKEKESGGKEDAAGKEEDVGYEDIFGRDFTSLMDRKIREEFKKLNMGDPETFGIDFTEGVDYMDDPNITAKIWFGEFKDFITKITSGRWIIPPSLKPLKLRRGKLLEKLSSGKWEGKLNDDEIKDILSFYIKKLAFSSFIYVRDAISRKGG